MFGYLIRNALPLDHIINDDMKLNKSARRSKGVAITLKCDGQQIGKQATRWTERQTDGGEGIPMCQLANLCF